MALVVKDRVKTTTSTAGTGALAVSGFSADFQSFNAIGDGNTTYYTIVHNGFGEWEVGIGTYTAAGASLSRDTVLESSNGGALVDFNAGTKDVFVAYPAERAVFTDVEQALTNKTISVDNNTLSGIAASSFVLSNASGNLDGSAAQKAIPMGVVVGTTDTQTLTNKTINGNDNTITNVNMFSGVTDVLRVENGGTGASTVGQARTNLGASTLGANLFTITNPSAVTFPRFNANNTVSSLSAADFRTAIGAGTGDVTTSGTQTLTNKAITQRAVSASATSGTITPNADTTDLYVAVGLTGAITIAQPSGTPTNGQKLLIRLKDNGTARGITWTTSAGAFRAVGITLPTTTVLGKVTYVGCVYNSTDSFWDAVATVTQA